MSDHDQKHSFMFVGEGKRRGAYVHGSHEQRDFKFQLCQRTDQRVPIMSTAQLFPEMGFGAKIEGGSPTDSRSRTKAADSGCAAETQENSSKSEELK
jgi:hypothetical protein